MLERVYYPPDLLLREPYLVDEWRIRDDSGGESQDWTRSFQQGSGASFRNIFLFFEKL